MTPAWAAQPGCRRLVHEPSARYSMMPAAWLPQMPKAWTSWSSVRPWSRPAAAAAAKLAGERGRVEVARVEAAGHREADAAHHLHAGDQRLEHGAAGGATASPTASAVVTATQPVWTMASSRVSSKSSPWASVALASTALAAPTRALAADQRALGRPAQALGHADAPRGRSLPGGGQGVAERVEREQRGRRDHRAGDLGEIEADHEAGQAPGSGHVSSCRRRGPP